MTIRGVLCAAAVVLLSLPAAASAQGLFRLEGEFGRFDDPRALAIDQAGRVYVADAAAKRVYVFDRAGDGNRLLNAIGIGQLERPTGVAVDNRGRVYVTDAARDVIEMYESASERFRGRGTLSGPGTAPGELDQPYAITADPSQRLYAIERGNLRVSVFRPARKRAVVFQTAFGIALPERFGRPAAVARDTEGRLFVANAEAGNGMVRAFDRRGRYIASMGQGAFSAPHGVDVDRFDRLIVADTGNDRIAVFGPLRKGAPPVDALGGFSRPLGVAYAPGSLVYVLEGNRVVRLRFDDADNDGVPDVGDNCLGLANPLQSNSDSDPAGDDCDTDDDDDGLRDADDRCPAEPGRPDSNRDGCRDAVSRFLAPAEGRSIARSGFLRITGRTEAGLLGVQRMQVALARRLDTLKVNARGARCSWLNPRARSFVEGLCSRPVWFAATGRASWRVRIPAGLVGPGRYAAFARAQQRGGPLERGRVVGRNVRSFSVR